MGLLEDALRDTLAAQVETPPVVDDAAGRAIRRARVVRRRRNAVAVAAVVASVFVTGFGVASMKAGQGPADFGLAGRPGRTIATTPASGRPVPTVSASSQPSGRQSPQHGLTLPVDVLNGNEIAAVDGRVIALADMPEARSAWRVAGGWLVETFDAAATPSAMSAVWFVSDGQTGHTGAPAKLAEGAWVAVGKGQLGPMVSWGGEGRVAVASLSRGELVSRQHTDGVGDLAPVGIVGNAVLLGHPGSGGFERYEIWFPAKGSYAPGPRSDDRIVGATADGARLFALTDGCLSLVNPVGFKVDRQTCRLDLGVNPTIVAAPEGRWIVVLRADRVDLYELAAVWTAARPTASWTIEAGSVAWLDGSSFAVGASTSVVRLSATDPARRERTEVFVAEGGMPTVIADLRG